MTGKSGWIMNTDKRANQALIGWQYSPTCSISLWNITTVSATTSFWCHSNFIDGNNLSRGYLKQKDNCIVDQAASLNNWMVLLPIPYQSHARSVLPRCKFDDSEEGEKEIAAFKAKHQTIAPQYI